MQICRFYDPSLSSVRLGFVYEGLVYDLTEASPDDFSSITSFLALEDPGEYLRSIGNRIFDQPSHAFDTLNVPPDPNTLHLLAPIDRQEVWAAGVTYFRSKRARMEESKAAADHYDRVYEAERPELFFKATPHRVSGPNGPVRIRQDSRWNVPEPELALVIGPDMTIKGYTIGNDMSSRDIEGENPLYLPQAKVYLECCSLGPVITLADAMPDPRHLAIHLTIQRGDNVVFEGDSSTSQIKRTFADLLAYLAMDNRFPNGVFLLTGTGIVPGEGFSLAPGDEVQISIQGIGVLSNYVHTGASTI